MDKTPTILIIDDDPIVRTSLNALLSTEPYELVFAENGIIGLEKAAKILPDAILLDVMMPGMDGFEVCRRLRENADLAEVPILIITTLDDRESRLNGIKAGADDYIPKPFDRLELVARLQSIVRLNRYRKIAEQRQELEELNKELLLSYDKTIEGWSKALDLRDKETEGHTERVTDKTMYLAHAMGLSEDFIKSHIWRGCLLHDVGKLGIPDAILLKEGPLTDEEWNVMRKHPVYAYEWLKAIPFLEPAIDIPYCHHEKWDGSGYPRGLKGEEIPVAARLFAIVDVWDAITSDRPYRKAMSREEAVQHILDESGKHFDPQIVKLFMDNIGFI
ncbi:MAG: cyclic di-GMP phosphodiesterase [Chloroflexota bacterium]|nr:cyclic di-GMP phosphodiesterase [Chloroflexota bacterium]